MYLMSYSLKQSDKNTKKHLGDFLWVAHPPQNHFFIHLNWLYITKAGEPQDRWLIFSNKEALQNECVQKITV